MMMMMMMMMMIWLFRMSKYLVLFFSFIMAVRLFITYITLQVTVLVVLSPRYNILQVIRHPNIKRVCIS